MKKDSKKKTEAILKASFHENAVTTPQKNWQDAILLKLKNQQFSQDYDCHITNWDSIRLMFRFALVAFSVAMICLIAYVFLAPASTANKGQYECFTDVPYNSFEYSLNMVARL